jgi:ubiquinone/menaquinone biosynthesis C-methylase UbiE
VTEQKSFDHYSHAYENFIDTPQLLSIGGATSREFIGLKCRELLEIARSRGLDPLRSTAVDAGCGTGIAEEFLQGKMHKTIGVDCSDGMVQEAKRKRIPGSEFLTADAAALPLADASADIHFSLCIFHHADPAQLTALLSEAKRVLRSGGLLTIFEHNPLNPLTRYVVRKCPVDKDVILVKAGRLKTLVQAAGFKDVKVRYLIFFPRSLKPLLPLERFLHWCPFGGQYAIIARRP